MNSLNFKIYELSKNVQVKKSKVKSVNDNSSSKSKVEPGEHQINIHVQDSVLESNADINIEM
jgi:hypothetical protein